MALLNPNHLEMDRCPHCKIYKPNLQQASYFETTNAVGNSKRSWFIYKCSNCGGVVSACADKVSDEVREIYPSNENELSNEIPERAKRYLQQAIDTIHSPDASIMVACSSIDAMLKEKEKNQVETSQKEKNYKEASLYSRIDKAAEDHLITKEMAQWAHQVRLEANSQRHADLSDDLSSTEDAQRVINFAKAFAEYLFVLPAMVADGIQQATKQTN